jgi:hypothetical protein
MSVVIFNNLIDMATTAATPSADGYTIGYDNDGIIKQKDALGVVTPLFNSADQNLAQVLYTGNDSGAYSIMMGTATSIFSSNSTSLLRMDYNGGFFLSVTASFATASIGIYGKSISILNTDQFGTSNLSIKGATFSSTVSSSTQSISISQSNKSFSISHVDTHAGISNATSLEIGSSYDSDSINNKLYVHINSKGADTITGVENTVIIGGKYLTASVSDTVYLGNSVNINNEYTLPGVDGSTGQYLKTDGAGNVSWSSVTATIPPLKDVLAVGNNSGYYSIIMGTSQGIKSANGTSSILLDQGGLSGKILISTDGPAMQNAYLQFHEKTLAISATSGTVTTGDRRGLLYTSDYTATFVNNSLVTKQYVDSIANSVFSTYKTAYVDPVNGSDTTGIVNRVDKPYQTVSKATYGITSSLPLSASDPALVYLKKGIYGESITMRNYVNYYCEQDVIFTNNGFNDFSEATTSNVYGHANFVSNSNSSLVPLDITRGSNISFEFGRIDNISVAFKITNTTGTSNVNIKGDYVKSQSQFGSLALIGDLVGTSEVKSDVRIDIRERIIGAYDVVNVRPNFIGSLYVECPEIVCDSDINTTTGPQPNVQHALIVRSGSASVSVRGDIYESTSAFSGGINSAVYAGGCDINIRGNITAGNCPGIYLDASFGTFSVKGDITSTRESIINSSHALNLRVSDSLIKTEGSGTNACAIEISAGTQSSTYIHNSKIYNSLVDSDMILLTTTYSRVGIYNSLGYSAGSAGKFAYNPSTSTASVGIHNTRSNKDNSNYMVDEFSPSGFIIDPGLYIDGF